ncbi:Ig-like domain-containing protein [Lacticaseibacillus porcinae]|uniref:Ig-like domain-containing protein n=1 Tax=Lacticaseibacillus porcinae TaxID=1123687 RepID=UPI000F7AAB88|nr:Ig-like domain-containing protein [Lacticaseibacillus porcinae]
MRIKKIWIMTLLILIGLTPLSSVVQVNADVAGSIVPPVSTLATSPGGTGEPSRFVTPGTLGTASGQYSSPLNWQSPISTTTNTQYAVLHPNQTVKVYSRYYYTGAGQVRYRTAFQKPGSFTVSPESQLLSGTNQAGMVTALDNNDPVLQANQAPQYSANVGYELTAPEVSSPTWVYFQSMYRGSDWIANYVGSRIFAILVLPTDFQYQNSLSASVIFSGLSLTASTTTSIPGVTPSFTTTTTSGAGTWGVVNGINRFDAAGVGITTATYALPVSAPWPNSGTTTNFGNTQTAYIGKLNDQTATVGTPATFTLQLPDGLTASDVLWFVGTTQLSGTQGTVTTPPTTIEQNNAQVRAIIGNVYQNGQSIAQSVAAYANLYVTDATLDLTTTSPIVYSGSQVPTGSNQVQAAATWGEQPTNNVTWTVDDPSLATIDAHSGLLTANTTGKTGTVTIIGTYQNGSVQQTATVPVTVARQPETQLVTVDSNFTLTAPAVSSGSYQWQRFDASTQQWQNIANATSQTYQSTASLADDGAQFRVRTTHNQVTIISNPTTLIVNPAGLAFLNVPDYQFAALNSAGTWENPKVAELIAGKYRGSATINWDEPSASADTWLLPQTADPVVIADSIGNGFKLNVSLSPFKSGNDAYLTDDQGGSVAIAFGLNDGSQWQATEIFDDDEPVNIYSGDATDPSTGRATLAYQTRLSLDRLPHVLAAQYSSAITWTLVDAP